MAALVVGGDDLDEPGRAIGGFRDRLSLPSTLSVRVRAMPAVGEHFRDNQLDFN
jgi:hypothetical protein